MPKYKTLYTSLYEASVTSLRISALPREYGHRPALFRCHVSLQWGTATLQHILMAQLRLCHCIMLPGLVSSYFTVLS